ncbi:MAG: hypothetical protein AAFY31_16620 [Pseudomonadota bacterium]
MTFVELLLVWFIYFCFGLLTQYDLPIWAVAGLVVIVDRLVARAGALRRPEA